MPDESSLFFQKVRTFIREILALLPELRALIGELVFTGAAIYGFVQAFRALTHG